MLKKRLGHAAGLGLLLATVSPFAIAQDNPDALQAVPPPMEFASSAEHYQWLLDQAESRGGPTQHTLETVPQWRGLWNRAGNNNNAVFLDGENIREGVLTPAYQEQFAARRLEEEQRYDRLTHCEPAGYPRWLREPYTREFVNTPWQSWMLNDFMNETRRVYIGQEHKDVFGTHSWHGDTIGFWDGDKLITHTVDVLPGDYFRGQPLTSNAFEAVEVWQMKTLSDGSPRLEVQVTAYDEHSLQKPAQFVYGFIPDTVEATGVRIRQWECETTSNSYRDANGDTQFLLPGDAGYKDARGLTEFGDLPGQSRDPVYETQLLPLN